MDYHLTDPGFQDKTQCVGDCMSTKIKKWSIIGVLLILLLPAVSADSPFNVIATVPPFVRPGDENVTIQLTVKLEDGEYDDVEIELILPRFFSPSNEGSECGRGA